MRPARLVAVALAGAAALAGANSAMAANGSIVLRPTSAGGTYAYTTREAPPYLGAHAVVHYVTTGPAAPPLADADGDGYPDYVEQVSADAEKALLYYARHGFKQPLADSGGPDAKPDIYVDTLPARLFGLTFTQTRAEAGTFVIVSPKLDVRTTKPLGSLSITIAHELFHVIQFSYVASGNLPLWAAEASASALSMLVFPQVQDLAMKDYLDAWLRAPWLPLYDERASCAHCYGGAWWWLYLARLNNKILPRYLAALAADDARGVATRVGVTQLDRALRGSRAGSLYDVFTRFSLNLYRRGLPVGSAYSLKTSTTPRTTAIRSVFGLSTHYVPISVPARARGVVVAVPYGGGPRPQVTLVVGGPKGRQVAGKRFRPGQGVILSTLFRNARERRRIVLIVTSGRANGVRYAVQYAAVGTRTRLPSWIAF